MILQKMTRFQKIRETVLGLIMIFAAVVMMLAPSEGYAVIILIIGVVYTLRGLSTVIYYFMMARFMVGGRSSLYAGIIMLDFGILTCSLTDVPHYYIFVYLIAIHGFSGIVEVLRSLEARRAGAGSWRLKMGHGLLNIAITVVCFVYIRQTNVAVFVYSLGLIYSGVLRIISSMRKTKMVYIQ